MVPLQITVQGGMASGDRLKPTLCDVAPHGSGDLDRSARRGFGLKN